MEDVYTAGRWWLELTSSTGTKAAALATLKTELDADAVVCPGDTAEKLGVVHRPHCFGSTLGGPTHYA